MRVAHDIICSFFGIIITLAVSPPFLLGSWQLSGTSSVVSGRDDLSLTSVGIIDEAITTCFDSLLKGVSLPAPLHTLLNHWVSTLYA